MTRFFCILIGAYNFFILLKVWALASRYFLKPILNYFPAIAPIFVIVICIFFFIHSVRLILFYEISRKIQMILSAIDPFLRIFILIMFYVVEATSQSTSSTRLLIFVLSAVFIALDVGVVVYLRLKYTKETFRQAEDWREEKYRRKLMERPIKIS